MKPVSVSLVSLLLWGFSTEAEDRVKRSCLNLWDNTCTSNQDCCSKHCYKESNWLTGVCKPGEGEGGSSSDSSSSSGNQNHGCKALWDNSCVSNNDCCSHHCSKQPDWAYGICKPGSDSGNSGGSSSGSNVQSGVCSWYGEESHGALTASGQAYNMHAMTAAHKTLPFNTRVTATCNGRSVTVTVNDRGPYTAGRILDLSKAAATHLGIIDKGICQCTITS